MNKQAHKKRLNTKHSSHSVLLYLLFLGYNLKIHNLNGALRGAHVLAALLRSKLFYLELARTTRKSR